MLAVVLLKVLGERERSMGLVTDEMEMEGEEEGFNGLVGRAVAMGGGMRGNRRKKVTIKRGGKETRGTRHELVRMLGSLEKKLEQTLVIVRGNERERERERFGLSWC
jgi:hypothetical protein